MDLQCIVCIANSSYAVKTPKDEVTCDTYWNFCKKLKIWTCFPLKLEISRSNERMRDNLSKRESPIQNRRVGTYALWVFLLYLLSYWFLTVYVLFISNISLFNISTINNYSFLLLEIHWENMQLSNLANLETNCKKSCSEVFYRMAFNFSKLPRKHLFWSTV